MNKSKQEGIERLNTAMAKLEDILSKKVKPPNDYKRYVGKIKKQIKGMVFDFENCKCCNHNSSIRNSIIRSKVKKKGQDNETPATPA